VGAARGWPGGSVAVRRGAWLHGRGWGSRRILLAARWRKGREREKKGGAGWVPHARERKGEEASRGGGGWLRS
jgi:hypothetical protein